MGVAALGAIYRAELKLLSRNTAVAISATALPLLFGTGFVLVCKLAPIPLGWPYGVAMQLMIVFGMTACVTSATTVSYRRDELYLKRLRCGEASSTTVLLGVLSPVITATLIQCLVMLTITGFAAPAIPTNPALLVVLLLAGTGMSVAVGVASAGVTSSGEQAQVVALPFFLLLVGSLVWAGTDLADGLSVAQRLLPGGAALELARLSYGASGGFVSQLAAGVLPVMVLLGWAVLGILAASKYFRWEPRN